METEPLIIGFMFLVIGGLTVVRPDFLIRLQIWTQKVIMRAQYIPSERTYLVARIVGAFIFAIGLAAITGIFELK
ncbi:MAG: hypothetical protein U1D26_02855, partial [Patescibacteria group bacterium]|nr:hypothetical protein [bacterium]MDZ4227396.1 hypothetical protein [Patescibacteria group bacterium]